MSALAQKHGAVNLGQGFPDYPIDPALIDLVTDAMRAGHNQYPLMPGVLALREAIAAKVQRLYGRAYDPVNEITVTTGATQAIFTTIQALAHPGDEVIVFEPAYDSYVPAVQLAGANPVTLALTLPDYRIDWEAVRRAVTPRTRFILLNTPNNPGTSVLSAADVAELAAIVRATPIVVISDEVYEHMVYDGARHESLARHDELAARSVVIGSFGKTFHATGWKVGYALAPAALTAEIRRVHQFTVFTVNSPVQHGLAAFLADPSRYETLPQFFAQKRDLFRDPSRGRSARPAAVRRQLLPAGALRPRQRRARGRVRAAARRRVRRGVDPAVGVLPRRHRSPRDPLLLRQAGGNAARGRAAPRAPVRRGPRSRRARPTCRDRGNRLIHRVVRATTACPVRDRGFRNRHALG